MWAAAQFESEVAIVGMTGEDHVTPWDVRQQFTAVLLRRRSS